MTITELRKILNSSLSRCEKILENNPTENQKRRLPDKIKNIEKLLKTTSYLETHTIRADSIPADVYELLSLYPELEITFSPIIKGL